MGYKETVMSDEQLKRINDAMPSDAKYGEVFKAIAEAQANLTWDIAVKEGYKKGVKDQYECQQIDLEEAEKAGIKKVVDWIKENGHDCNDPEYEGDNWDIPIEKWQAFLKEVEKC